MAVKQKCPKCPREVDSRGIKAHLLTHKPNNVQRIREKRGPVSVDFDSFRLGFKMGREVA